MSAFIVDKKHIDALVTAALTRRHSPGRFTWYNADPTKPGGMNYNELDFNNADEIGAMLLTENVRSVGYRYSDIPADELPGRCDNEWMEPYTFNRYRRPLEVVAILKAIDGYTYQSCEHPGWREPGNRARAFCEALTHALIGRLPGYDDAPTWSICE